MPSCTSRRAISGVMAGAQEKARLPEHAGGGPAVVGWSRSTSELSYARCDALLQQHPFALLQLHEHACALVDAVEPARLEIVDAVCADNVVGRLHRLVKRRAEFLGPGLRLRQSALGGIEQHQPGVEGIGGECVA